MGNMKIKAKMILCFGIVIALAAFLAVFAVIQLRSVDTAYTNVLELPVMAKEAIYEFTTATNDVRRLGSTISTFAPTTENSRIDGYYTQAVEAFARGEDALKAYDDLVHANPNLDQAGRESRLNQTKELRNLFKKYWDETIIPVTNAARGGDHQGTITIMLNGAATMGELAEAGEAMLKAVTDSRDSQKVAATEKASTTELIVAAIAVVILIISVIIALALATSISKPLIKLTNYMNRAGSTGAINFTQDELATIEQQKHKRDEIGQCIGAISKLIAHVSHISGELELVAKGDLTTQVEFLSNEDVMGMALQHMVDNLNKLFGEINSSTSQVSSGSKQIADGAQILAQGSTQQASAVEELSSEVKQIAEQTQQNSEMANKAAGLGNTIKAKAETGSRQMDEMMEAVRDINQASQSISKVIKAIDDIAFQTNILALNAAVEAARAGQHGKGFAVVAEEVRNLASKSADAAKETGVMIQNSVEKAELGTRIAESTSASLTEIVAGINESSQIVNQIASSSESQSAGIAQINSGIDQVAQVVQQNSATAEESAAAAEEMSGQSATLEDLVAQFKLKDGTRGIRRPAQSAALPPSGNRQINMPSKTAYTPTGGEFGKY
ncbi:MAG: methyl-accepting chemotaxis protein [Oscillospiraceae bacterium]|nr:methyl-accepting chemotaxis protein [Oscillospiraceae bacterium]